MMNSSSIEDNSPSASFQKLCQTMLDGSSRNLTKKNVEDFRVILHMIMHECSKANIETGKHWVFDHCQSPIHIRALMDYIYALSESRSGQEERVHMLYLINDVVFNIARKQLTWMRDAILPLLTPFLKLVYDTASTPECKAKIAKVINFWYTKSVFESDIIDAIKKDVTGESIQSQPHHQADSTSSLLHLQETHHQKLHLQPPSPLQQPHMLQQQPPRIAPASSTQQHRPPGLSPMPLPEKPYYEMPAGLMLLTKGHSYEPLDPAMIKIPYPRPPPSEALMTAVDEFYSGMELVNADDVILSDKASQKNKDTQGWERGYLDGYMEAIQQQKRDMLERQKIIATSPVANMNRRAHDRYRSPGFSSGSRSRIAAVVAAVVAAVAQTIVIIVMAILAKDQEEDGATAEVEVDHLRPIFVEVTVEVLPLRFEKKALLEEEALAAEVEDLHHPLTLEAIIIALLSIQDVTVEVHHPHHHHSVNPHLQHQ
ncbi:hypothetical protein [Parasitella parasitica]|uniref:CID domain-containing protein n=1 Tax=Parasitella parasitica TaxID=35722 RepID=A0A0B7NNH9_9FUNG|nr:hypothetical protein [Parasitella parasitica]